MLVAHITFIQIFLVSHLWSTEFKIIYLIIKKHKFPWKYIEITCDDCLKNIGHLNVRQQCSKTPGSNWNLFNFALSFVFDST